MRDEDNNNSGVVDLGLSQLLSPENNQAGGESAKTLDIDSFINSCIEARTAGSSTGNSHLSEEPENLWLAHWKKLEYSTIIETAERTLQDQPDNVEARLWWIRSHCAAASMPISLIAAPAETICKAHSFTPGSKFSHLQSLFHMTLIELSNACWINDLKRKSINFLHTVTEHDDATVDTLLERVTLELGTLSIGQLPIAERDAAEEYRRHLKNLEKELSIKTGKPARKTAPSTDQASSTSTNNHGPDNRLSGIFWLQLKAMTIPVALTGFLITAGFYGYTKGFAGSAPMYSPVVELDDSGIELTLEIPFPERKTASSGPTLWNILKNLEDVDGTQKAISAPRSVSNVNVPGNTTTVNTTLPVEPPELALLVTAWDQREVLSVRSSEGSSNATLAIETDSERSGTIVEGYPKLAGISREIPQKQSGPVEAMYLVIEETPVFMHPATDASSVAVLQIGNHVEVAEVLGEWYKIVSAKNRIGYIPVRVAKPLPQQNQ